MLCICTVCSEYYTSNLKTSRHVSDMLRSNDRQQLHDESTDNALSGCLSRFGRLSLLPDTRSAWRRLGHEFPRQEICVKQAELRNLHVVRSKRSLPSQGRQLRRVRSTRRYTIADTRLVGSKRHGDYQS